MPRRLSLRVLIGLLVGSTLLALLLAMLGFARLREALASLSLLGFVAFALASAGVVFLYALRARVVLRAVGAPVDPPLAELAAFRLSAHAASFLVPAGQLAGEPLRIVLFRDAGCDLPDAALAVVVDRWMEATASAIVGPIYVTIFLLATGLEPELVVPSIVIWTLSSLALVGVYVIAARRGRLLSMLFRGPHLQRFAAGLAALEQRFATFLFTPAFWRALALALAAEVLIVAEFALLLSAFAIPASLATVLGILVGMGIASLAPIPAGLGVLEGAQVGVASLIGAGGGLGLAIGFLVRLRETLWTAIGLLYLWSRGFALLAPSEPERGSD